MNKHTLVWVAQYDYSRHEFDNQAEIGYELWHLLDLVDEATSWDEVVLDDTYTASDILESVVFWMKNINSQDYENLDLLFEAVENELSWPDKTKSGFSYTKKESVSEKETEEEVMDPMEEFMFENWYGLVSRGIVPIYGDAEEEKYVVGRDLHKALQIKSLYKDWIKRVVLKNRTEGKDFWVLQNGRKKEHVFTAQVAFDIAQRSVSKKGRAVAHYLKQV